MPSKGGLRELIATAEQHPARWAMIAAGVLVLLWLKLVLFAAALPVMAYWHYSNQAEDLGDADPDACDGAEDENADLDPPWHPEDDEADGDDDGVFPGDDGDRDAPPNAGKEDRDPYDKSFWSAEDTGGAPKRNAPWRSAPRDAPGEAAAPGGRPGARGDDGDPLGLDSFVSDPPAAKDLLPKPKHSSAPWDSDGPNADPLDDLGLGLPSKPSKDAERGFGGEQRGLGARAGEPDILDSLGLDDGGLQGPGLDHDFGLGLLGDSMDFFGGGSMGGGKGKGKGKGKSKGGEKGPRDPMAPREPNPKQVFVANVGDMPEDDIRAFFEDVGEVDRLKVLRTPEGDSKGVCFVTFRTEEQAQKALTLHGTMLEGKNLVVRLAHGGNKGGEKGDKGDRGGKGGDRFGGDRDRMGGDRNRFGGDRDRFGGDRDRFGGDRDRFGGDRDRFGGDRDRFGGGHEGLPDLGGSERFGAAFGDSERDRGDRGDRGGFGKGGSRGGKGPGGKRTERGEMDDLLEEALAEGDGPVKPADFDFAARRFLSELRSRDRLDGTSRFQEAIDMVLKYTSSKDRLSVRKWPAYIFTLLQKFDPSLWEELRERDAERRREKGAGGYGAARERKPSD